MKSSSDNRAAARDFPDRPVDFPYQLTDRRLPPISLILERDHLVSVDRHRRPPGSRPVANADTEQRGHCVEQRAEALIGVQVAADKSGFLTASAVLEDSASGPAKGGRRSP